MVEIIPYTEDDEDSSTWIPLIAPGQNISGSDSARIQTKRSGASNDESDNSFVSHDVSSHSSLAALSAPSQTGQPSISESKPSFWEMQLISHLTSTPSAPVNDEGYSSENDDNIDWKHANELNDGNEWWVKRERQEPNLTENEGSQPQRSRSSYTHHNEQQQRQHTADKTGNTRIHIHQGNASTSYRQEAKNKLQQSLIYHPMRELPFRIIRNLYIEGKHELYQAWISYILIQNNGDTIILAPLTFFMFVAFLGIILIGIGVSRIACIAVFASIRVTVSFLKLTVWGARGMLTHLAWLSLLSFVAIGALIWISVVKVRNPLSASNLANPEPDSQGAPNISTAISLLVAFTSPSMYELVACLYSFRALSLPVSYAVENDLHHTYECDASIRTVTTLPPFTSVVTSLVVVTLTCLGIYTFSEYLDRGSENHTQQIENTEERESSTSRQLNRCLRRIQRNLNACHTLSVVILALSAAIFLFLRASYLYFEGDFVNILSGLSILGYHLFCVTIGAILLSWSGKAAFNELSGGSGDDGDNNLYQRIFRNSLKESIIDVTTNAVWSNVSGLSGVLSEDDGILRLAMLEWLIDRLSPSETTQSPPSSTNASRSGHQEFSHSTNQSDINSSSINGETKQSKSKNNTPEDETQNTGSANVEILKNLPSYASIEKVITNLDADEALIPAIQSYRIWIYSLPPSRNIAMAVACWKMCPGIVALLLFAIWSFFMRSRDALVTFLQSQYVVEYCVLSNVSRNNILGLLAFVMSPIVYLEYLRVCRWWDRVVCNIEETKSNDGVATAPDSFSIMLEYDYDKLSSPSFLNKMILKIWGLLLESIDLLESSIPVVRCATVACATANLTSDAACLLDLAVEIKNRGLLAGIGMLVVDVFSHHLHEELQRRHAESNNNSSSAERTAVGDEIGGKYTNSLIKSVGHASKIVHNLSQLQGDGKKSKQPPNEKENAYNDSDNELSLDKGTEPPDLDISSKDTSNNTKTVVDDPKTGDCKTMLNGFEPTCSGAFMSTSTASDCQGTAAAQVIGKHDDNTQSVVSHTDEQATDVATSKTENVDNFCDENEKGDAGMPMWLGGGLAVVGAVVGSLAVAAASGKKDKEKNQRRESDSK